MCFLYNKGHNLHTWFNFSISSNTQKEDLGGTQVGNDHVSRAIDNLATSQGRNWAQVELLLVTGQGLSFFFKNE